MRSPTEMYRIALAILNDTDAARYLAARRALRAWMDAGRPVPPPDAYKHATIRWYARIATARVLVETGTYLGDTVRAVRRSFKIITSFELDPELARRAQQRFRKEKHVRVMAGDSAVLLPACLRTIDERCLFWLDAHYSHGITARGALDTPIASELKTIFDHPIKDHVILIDDARSFVGQNDYPTIPELREIILAARPTWEFSVKDDIIRAHPPGIIPGPRSAH